MCHVCGWLYYVWLKRACRLILVSGWNTFASFVMKQPVGTGGAIVDATCQWNILCLQIPITLHKEPELDPEGREVLKCGFKIGGGIDQDYRKSPQGYTDNVCLLHWHLWPVCVSYRTLYLCTSHNKNSFLQGWQEPQHCSVMAGGNWGRVISLVCVR